MELTKEEISLIESLRRNQVREPMKYRRLVIMDMRSDVPFNKMPYNEEKGYFTTAGLSEAEAELMGKIMSKAMDSMEELAYEMIPEVPDRKDGRFAEWILLMSDN